MTALSISVVSDVICPWCYLGKRRLERALDGLGLRSETPVDWLPFELNPDMPVQGRLDQQMTALGLDEEIRFAFERQTRTPNTRRAHALIAAAMGAGHGNAVVAALFRGYFEEGLDVGDPAVLADLAAAAGMKRDAALHALDDAERHKEVRAFEAEASRLGVTGVPFFIVNQAYAISGAQPAEVLMQAFTRIAAAPAA
jgi:predicted DsbA family dithiol-disulfide isomerase